MFNHEYDYRPTQSFVTNYGNHNFNKIFDILGSFFNQNTGNSKTFFLASSEKKPFKRACGCAYCPITKGQVALEGNFRFVLDKFDLKSASDKKFVRRATVNKTQHHAVSAL